MRPWRYRGVLFDLFGTLLQFDARRLPTLGVDGRALPSTVPAMEELLARIAPAIRPVDLADALRVATIELAASRGPQAVEFPSRERFARALRRLMPGADVGEPAAVLSRAHLATLASCTVLPAAHLQLFASVARSHGVAIASNFDDTATVRALLEVHRLFPLVDSLVVSESVGVRKPNPLPIRVALDELGLAPGEAILVGDTFVEDVAGAHAAGVDAAWIDTRAVGPPAGAPPPRFTLRSLIDLERVLSAG